MSDNEPSVQLVAMYLAQQAYIASRPFDRAGARAYSLNNWRNFAGRAADFLACRRALREKNAASSN